MIDRPGILPDPKSGRANHMSYNHHLDAKWLRAQKPTTILLKRCKDTISSQKNKFLRSCFLILKSYFWKKPTDEKSRTISSGYPPILLSA
jgi:hypothetical protein